jgi:hypothetical protein
MQLTVIQGVIRRRILVNFRIDPGVMQAHLPQRFRPKLHEGHAIAGICLIRLEVVRPRFVPQILGLSSENAAHRIAVHRQVGDTKREGVFIWLRRQTLAGGLPDAELSGGLEFAASGLEFAA